MSKLKKNITLSSHLSPTQVRSIISENCAHIEEFKIVSKLSAGGIVVRTLQAPKSEQPFFGILDGRITIAELRYSQNLTPYQPLLHIDVQSSPQGSRLEIHCAKHPKMFELGILYNIAGILLLIAGIPLFSIRTDMASVSIFFGVILLIYPTLRAQISFTESVDSAIESLKKLPLQLYDP